VLDFKRIFKITFAIYIILILCVVTINIVNLKKEAVMHKQTKQIKIHISSQVKELKAKRLKDKKLKKQKELKAKRLKDKKLKKQKELKAKRLKAKRLKDKKLKKQKELKAKKLKKEKELKAKKLKKEKELKAKKLKVKKLQKAKELKAKKLKVKKLQKAKELKKEKELRQLELFEFLNMGSVDFNLKKYTSLKVITIQVINKKGVLEYKILTKKVPDDVKKQLSLIIKSKNVKWVKKNINENFGKIIIKIELTQ